MDKLAILLRQRVWKYTHRCRANDTPANRRIAMWCRKRWDSLPLDVKMAAIEPFGKYAEYWYIR